MIAENRPLKMVAYSRPNCLTARWVALDAFDNHGCETLDIENIYSNEDGSPYFVEACHADWYEKDGTVTSDGFENVVHVKCLEVAVWYVAIGGRKAGGAGSYCEYHRPRVMST